MPTLSYDLHVHPGPSRAPRWGDGRRVWHAARAAGVHGFVWKAHEQHTVELCRELPTVPVRAFASASLNPWASLEDVVAALEGGALWLWGPTTGEDGRVGWDLQLPSWWPQLAERLTHVQRRLVLATGHLDLSGRLELARFASAHDHLVCSVTHCLLIDPDEVPTLRDAGCLFEIDAYTLTVDIAGRTRMGVSRLLSLVGDTRHVYFTSDGGQEATGNPFLFGARALDRLEAVIGAGAARAIGIERPAAIVDWLDVGAR
jgi:Family of unknown function (DUF6282)